MWLSAASRPRAIIFGVNSLAQNVRFALYRDFPDPQRQRGAERF